MQVLEDFTNTLTLLPEAPRLVFGIYPGGRTEPTTETRIFKEDDAEQVEAALTELQAEDRPFWVRGYMIYVGNGKTESHTPTTMTQYVHDGRRLDLVLCYLPTEADLEDWTDFIRKTVREYAPYLGKIQITEEPNNPDHASGGNGSAPQIYQAIVQGVIAAKDEARQQGIDVQVGFNGVIAFNPADTFWATLATFVTDDLLDALDYVGVDFFPDVFRPIPAEQLADATAGALAHFRTNNLVAGGIPASIPIHITENGWSTGTARSYTRQAEVLDTIIRVVDAHRASLNITAYELFDLADARSDEESGFTQFGIMTDTYRPKPAFETYRGLIAELGATSW